jgi:hypothetical protein
MAYMNFRKTEKPRGKVTETWEVTSTASGCLLGCVLWRTGWRRYVFEPEVNTVFDAVCLRELTDFVEQQTKLHKEG